jgi:hypothetical protein
MELPTHGWEEAEYHSWVAHGNSFGSIWTVPRNLAQTVRQASWSDIPLPGFRATFTPLPSSPYLWNLGLIIQMFP